MKRQLQVITMSKITINHIDLNNKESRKALSVKLQAMEQEFSYPLGEQSFFIKHGFGDQDYDYFSYFEQLGIPYFFAIEKKDKMIGSICFILREIEQRKVWYICDLKIIKEEQSKRILFMMYNLLKIQLASITTSYYFVNMAPVKNNGMFKIASQVLRGFNMDIQPLYIYDVKSNNPLLSGKTLAHNHGKKDIVINSKSTHLYHIIDDTVANRAVNILYKDKEEIEEDATVMFCSYIEIENLIPSSVGIFAKSNMDIIPDFSTFEI